MRGDLRDTQPPVRGIQQLSNRSVKLREVERMGAVLPGPLGADRRAAP